MDEIARLLGVIEGVAPEVWRIALQQVAVNVRVSFVWIVVLGGLVVAAACFSYGKFKEGIDTEEGYGWALAALVASLFALAAGSGIYAMMANPEYAAIKILLKLVSP